MEGGAGAGEDGPVAVLQIGDLLGERGAVLGAYDEFRVAGENDGERVSALQPGEGFGRRLFRGKALAEQIVQELGDGFGVCFCFEMLAEGFQFAAELKMVVDFAIEDNHGVAVV